LASLQLFAYALRQVSLPWLALLLMFFFRFCCCWGLFYSGVSTPVVGIPFFTRYNLLHGIPGVLAVVDNSAVGEVPAVDDILLLLVSWQFF
jgi:hypothetical protein